MSELGPEANELLEAGRQAFRPTAADRTRVLGALRGAATVTTGVAALTVSKWAWAAGLRQAWQAASLVRVAVVVAPVAAGGAYLWQVATTEAVPAPRAVPSPAIVASAAPQPAVVSTAPTAEALEPPPPSSEPDERRAAPAKSSGAARNESQVRQEVALLSKAQAELSRGRPQQALAALGEHAQLFPRGVLTEERMATRARALCALGRKSEAQSELQRVERLNASSAYLIRAREACGSR